MITAAVVGLGRIGAGFEDDPLRPGAVTHSGAWARHPAAELVAGVDPDEKQRERFERLFDRPAFASYSEMMQAYRPEMVSICTRPETHARLVLQAFESGARRVLCEKPCTPSLSDIRELYRRLGDASRGVGVNFTRRFDPLHRHVARVLRGGSILGGGGYYTAGLLNTASHWCADLLGFGAQIRELRAWAHLPGADLSPNVLFRLESGGTVFLQSFDVNEYLVYETDLFTSTHRARLSLSGTRAELFDVVDSARYSGYREFVPARASLPLGLSNPMLAVVDDAIASIEEDRPMACALADAVRVHEILDAVAVSIEEDRWVQLTGEIDD